VEGVAAWNCNPRSKNLPFTAPSEEGVEALGQNWAAWGSYGVSISFRCIVPQIVVFVKPLLSLGAEYLHDDVRNDHCSYYSHKDRQEDCHLVGPQAWVRQHQRSNKQQKYHNQGPLLKPTSIVAVGVC
jgi:hypothetical protein